MNVLRYNRSERHAWLERGIAFVRENNSGSAFFLPTTLGAMGDIDMGFRVFVVPPTPIVSLAERSAAAPNDPD